MAAAAKPNLTIYCKGNKGATKLGDCPFTQKALLCLTLHDLPFTTVLIDLTAKPQSFLDLPKDESFKRIAADNWKASCPVLEDTTNKVRVFDSGAICDYLENTFAPKVLSDNNADASKIPGAQSLGKNFFALVKDIGSRNNGVLDDNVDAEKMSAFVTSLKDIEGYLAENVADGAYLNGSKDISLCDIQLIPFFHAVAIHSENALNICITGENSAYPHLKAYLKTVYAQKWWAKASYENEVAFEVYREKFGLNAFQLKINKRPKDDTDDEKADAAPVNPLFAALNKGGAITAGLKKVTRDMTNKDKKISGKIEEKEAPKKKAAPAAAKKAKKVKPPSIRKQGFRVWVENFTSGVEEIGDVGLKNEVYLCNCSNAGFKIGAKVKTVTVDSCKKVQIEIGDVLTSVDMINSKGCTLYLKATIPTLNIDKCEAPRVVMFQECLDTAPQIITSMTSDMNLSLPGKTADDDFKDVPIPYQFTTTVDPNTKEVKTVPVDHSG